MEPDQLIVQVQTEIEGINEELNLQTEKLIGLQKKLGQRRAFLYENDEAVKSFKNALKIKKFLLLISGILILFIIGLALISRSKPG